MSFPICLKLALCYLHPRSLSEAIPLPINTYLLLKTKRAEDHRQDDEYGDSSKHVLAKGAAGCFIIFGHIFLLFSPQMLLLAALNV